MSIPRLIDFASLHLAILRGAALLVPGHQREEWFAEWRAELWYVWQRGNSEATRFCLGAFHDAMWLRCNYPRTNRKAALESPAVCISFLAVLGMVSLFFAYRLPGAREMMLPSQYGEARDLVMISTGGSVMAQVPTVSIAEYQSLTNSTKHLFTRFAYYRPIRTTVSTASGRTTQVSVALASRDLFGLLRLPLLPLAGDLGGLQQAPAVIPKLILSEAAWRKHFDSDPHIVGRAIQVYGRKAVVTGVLPKGSWRLPGSIDAWLLEDEQRLAASLPHGAGYVLAQVKTLPQRSLRWRLSAPDEQGGHYRFVCSSLARGHLMFAYFVMLVAAVVILPTTTSLALGEYPANRHSPPLATRLRRWMFLAIKIALLIVIVVCGILDLAAITSTPIQAHGLLVGFVLAFRWALSDQRKRCPVCLRLLSSPTRIGSTSQTFLEWYGTELICARGHGLLHVPEISTSCYGIQRWHYLDDSWAGLFTTRKVGAIT
jgi:hypothetical protein